MELVSKQRSDILVMLAISALLHGTDKAVRYTAKQLIKLAPGSICKSTLRPLSISDNACAIIIDEVVYPTDEKRIGTVRRGHYEYDIFVIWEGRELHYTVEDIVQLTTKMFIQRGLVDGRLYLSMIHPVHHGKWEACVDLADMSRYTAADARLVA